MLAELPVVAEQPDGYDREAFGDYDRDALLDESFAEHGGYYSEADDTLHDDTGDVHVDHLVPLAEAWRSGAYDWSDNRRDAFAADEANLWLMTADLNVSKSDADIDEWLPPDPDAFDGYIATWIAVKHAYGLTIDPAESNVLDDAVDGIQCPSR